MVIFWITIKARRRQRCAFVIFFVFAVVPLFKAIAFEIVLFFDEHFLSTLSTIPPFLLQKTN